MLKEMDPRFEHFAPEEDAKYLRRAIAVAEAAKAAGNHPFGAVLVDLQGHILMEQGNIEVTEKVCTGHAETTLLRARLSQIHPRFSVELHAVLLHRALLYVLRRRLLG